ncbi:MAG: hypothetical protein RB191_04585 [Terriglobia bacterium]|nr:hypothetical protein [Terriglobia bacterium]
MGKTIDEFKASHSLKDRITRLEAELAKAQRENADSAAIKSIIGDIAGRVESVEEPEWAAVAPVSKGSPGVPTLFLSDLHWGEVVYPSQINSVNKFNLSIARERLHYTVEKAIDLLRIIDGKMQYPGIVCPLGGDMISGNLHDELSASNEINSMPAVLDLYGHLVAVITRLADTFGAVFLPCVTGNHGRDTKKIWNKDRHHTSFDWLLYRFLAKHFEPDKRITFFVPDGNDAAFRIFGTRYNLTHGDKLGSGGDGLIGFLGPVLRGDHKKRSRNSQIDMEYDVMIFGHWHQYVHMNRVIGNGTLKGYDEFAWTNNFSFEVPQQALWVTHPQNGITFRMPVYCEPSPKAAKTNWISVPSGNVAPL